MYMLYEGRAVRTRPFLHSVSPRTGFRIAVVTVSLALALLVHGYVLSAPQAPTTGHVLPAAAPVTKASGASTSPQVNLAASQPTPKPTPSCTIQTPYVVPTALDLTGRPNGLSVVRDPVYTYNIGGQTVAELRASVVACPARQHTVGDYHAITARNIVWSYAMQQNGAVCRLSDVKVGLHLAQFMPNLADPATTPAETLRYWQTYHTNLVTHEEGHAVNATSYAQEITDVLTPMSAPSCEALQRQVTLTIHTELALLQSADELYDARTGHGATQGAVL